MTPKWRLPFFLTLLTTSILLSSVGVAHAPPLEPPSFCGYDDRPHPTVCDAYRDGRDQVFEWIEAVQTFIDEF